MEKIGLWMFLTAIVLAPWVSSWLKERERQKTIRTFLGKEGTVDEKLLDYFRQNEAEELARKKPLFRLTSSDQCIGFLVIVLSFMGGLTVLIIGDGIAGHGETAKFGVFVASIFASCLIWAIGFYVGINLHKRGSKNGSPPAE